MISVISLRRHPLSESVICLQRGRLLHDQRLEMREVSSRAVLCLKRLINHAPSLLGGRTQNTQRAAPRATHHLCVCPLVSVLTCSLCYTCWDTTPFMQTCPEGRYWLSGLIDPFSHPHFLPLLPHLTHSWCLSKMNPHPPPPPSLLLWMSSHTVRL